MKFEVYLEAVKRDVLNEIFGVKNVNIDFKQIPKKLEHAYFTSYFYDVLLSFKDIVKNPNDLLNIDIDKLDLSKTDHLADKKRADIFINAISKIKTGNYYLRVHSDRYIFRVSNFLYKLELDKNRKGYWIITFDKMLGNDDERYSSNSLFKIPGAKDQLFNKIRVIIEDRFKDKLKTMVFGFSSAIDASETSPREVYSFIELFNRELQNYINGKDVNLEKIKDFLGSSSGFKTKDKRTLDFIKTYLNDKTGTLNNPDAISFLNSVLQLKTPPPPSKIIKSFKINKPNEDEIEGSVGSKSMRTRLYKEVIRSLLGDQVYIKPKGNTTLFSLSPIPEG